MQEKMTAPYGSWVSPINADLIVSSTVGLASPSFDGDDLYWIEGRPEEAGRQVLVRRTVSGAVQDVIGAPFNVRTRVHEYGGGAYVAHQRTVYFSNFDDNLLYGSAAGGTPSALTSDSALRYADLEIDATRERIICIREDHRTSGQEAVNSIVAVKLTGGTDGVPLVEGNDFYASARVSPDGTQLAWITWDHPNLPWDGSELWIGTFATDGSLTDVRQVAGGQTESIFGPVWSPEGILYFTSDRTGWWNLYRCDPTGYTAVLEMDAEFGVPQWVFGLATYAFTGPTSIAGMLIRQATSSLYTLNATNGNLRELNTPYTALSQIVAHGNLVAFVAGSPTLQTELVTVDVHSGDRQVIRRSSDAEIEAGFISTPESIEFATENGLTAFAFYYPPTNGNYEAPQGELPPLIVISHGGPTGNSTATLDLKTQYWTSKGFGLVDVNYGGSTGYGREYRRRLNGQWGIVDVDDCVNAARYLARAGRVDPNRLIIRGGSAGGYTTLAALTMRDVFTAGASYYGVADLEVFMSDTHKFESRYDVSLIGPRDSSAQLYRERSPVNYIDQISCPVIIFQGLDDRVVPPSQAELMVKALEENHLPHAYVAFKGEGHGFRKAENIKRALDAELYFYSRVFNFPLGEEVEPVHVKNSSARP